MGLRSSHASAFAENAKRIPIVAHARSSAQSHSVIAQVSVDRTSAILAPLLRSKSSLVMHVIAPRRVPPVQAPALLLLPLRADPRNAAPLLLLHVPPERLPLKHRLKAAEARSRWGHVTTARAAGTDSSTSVMRRNAKGSVRAASGRSSMGSSESAARTRVNAEDRRAQAVPKVQVRRVPVCRVRRAAGEAVGSRAV